MSLIPARNYIFFDSKNAVGTSAEGMTIWDRAISAEQYARYNEAIFTSGVNPHEGNMFEIAAGNGLKIVRKSGHAMLGGRSTHDTEQREFAVLAGNTYYYIMESNTEVEYRCVREGVILASEVTFPLLRDINHYQIILAKIEIPVGAVQVTQNMITDYRYNPDYCGLLSLNANINIKQVIVTADDVRDTDTHLIPVKTEAVEKSLRGNGTYSDDMRNTRVGKYKTTYDDSTDTIHVIYERNENHSYSAIPTAYTRISGSGTITNPNNMLSDIVDSAYASLAAYKNTPTLIVLGMRDNVPDNYHQSGHNVDITAKIAVQAALSGFDVELSLYDYDTLTEIPNTTRTVVGTGTAAGSTTLTFDYHFDDRPGLNVIGLGVKIFRTLDSAAEFRFYGATTNITYMSAYRRIADISTNDVILYDANDNPISLIQQQSQGASYGLLLEAIEEGLS